MKNKILIISHDFPPTWKGGVIRIYSLVKQIINSGQWQVSIISADDRYSLKVFKDVEPLNNIKGRFTLIKTKSFEPKSKKFLQKVVGTLSKSWIDKIGFFILKNFCEPLLIPDRSILWMPYALLSGIRLIKQEQQEIIFSTAPPFTNFVVAKLLSSLFKKKLVVDFRDDWVGNPFPNIGFVRKKANMLLERWVVGNNTQIITTSFESKDSFVQKYGDQIQKRINVATNGFDEELCNKILSAEKTALQKKNEKVTFLYAGSLTPKRTPEFFLTAIKALVEKNDFPLKSIQINFVGYSPLIHKKISSQLGLNSLVNFIDSVSQDNLAQLYASSDILLLFQRSSEGGKTAIPGKFYEYLCARKPILLMSDGGATDNILKNLNAGYITKYESIGDIATTTRFLISSITNGKSLNSFNGNDLHRYSRSSINNQIMEIIGNQL